MTAARLRDLVAAATPGPWANYMNPEVLRKNDHTALRLAVFDTYQDPPGPITNGEANARLAALAPELAAWAATHSDLLDEAEAGLQQPVDLNYVAIPKDIWEMLIGGRNRLAVLVPGTEGTQE